MTNLDTVLFGGAMPSGGSLQSAHLPGRNNETKMHMFSNEKNKVGLGLYAPWLTMVFNVVWCNQKQIRFDEIKVTFIQVHEITKRDSTVNSSTRRKFQNKYIHYQVTQVKLRQKHSIKLISPLSAITTKYTSQ